MTLTVVMYLLYLLYAVLLTVWVAHTLSKNGRVFLVEVFHGDEGMADSVNHLLVVGFYLINLGYICRMLPVDTDLTSMRQVVETLAGKMGIVLLILGIMHFFNLYVFNRLRQGRLRERYEETMLARQAGGASH